MASKGPQVLVACWRRGWHAACRAQPRAAPGCPPLAAAGRQYGHAPAGTPCQPRALAGVGPLRDARHDIDRPGADQRSPPRPALRARCCSARCCSACATAPHGPSARPPQSRRRQVCCAQWCRRPSAYAGSWQGCSGSGRGQGRGSGVGGRAWRRRRRRRRARRGRGRRRQRRGKRERCRARGSSSGGSGSSCRGSASHFARAPHCWRQAGFSFFCPSLTLLGRRSFSFCTCAAMPKSTHRHARGSLWARASLSCGPCPRVRAHTLPACALVSVRVSACVLRC